LGVVFFFGTKVLFLYYKNIYVKIDMMLFD